MLLVAASFHGLASTSISKNPSSDFLIAGAGIIGLTVALELKKRFPSSTVAILEKEPQPGLHASGRNSGVLHSGIYYSHATLKAQACAEGARRMKAFAKEHGIPCHDWGKVIVAGDSSQVPALERLMKNAHDNGIRAERLDEKGIHQIEPHARAEFGGIICPDTAVIDSKAIVKKCAQLLMAQGVSILFGRQVVSANTKEKAVLTLNAERYSYGKFVNCAGAYADVVARKFGLADNYAFVPFKGIYFKLRAQRSELVRSSIYPVPDLLLPFLGVHFTRVVSGDVYVGPTAIPALGRENYGLFSGIKLGEALQIGGRLFSLYLSDQNNFRTLVHTELKKYWKKNFVKAAQKLVPDITADDLLPCDKVGIRPQLINLKENKLEMDYIVEKTSDSVHVLNAISPAFTGAFSFAEIIVNQLDV